MGSTISPGLGCITENESEGVIIYQLQSQPYGLGSAALQFNDNVGILPKSSSGSSSVSSTSGSSIVTEKSFKLAAKL